MLKSLEKSIKLFTQSDTFGSEYVYSILIFFFGVVTIHKQTDSLKIITLWQQPRLHNIELVANCNQCFRNILYNCEPTTTFTSSPADMIMS